MLEIFTASLLSSIIIISWRIFSNMLSQGNIAQNISMRKIINWNNISYFFSRLSKFCYTLK